MNGCDRQNQNLSNFILVGTKINGSDLSGCILNGAKLQYAKVSGSNLSNASLRGADLRHTDLRYSKLSNTDFSGADVQNALLQGSTGLTEEQKQELKAKGAIFDDSALKSLDTKWWIRYLLIPVLTLLLGSGGIVSWLEYLRKQPLNTPLSSPKAQPVNSGSPLPEPTATTKPRLPNNNVQ